MVLSLLATVSSVVDACLVHSVNPWRSHPRQRIAYRSRFFKSLVLARSLGWRRARQGFPRSCLTFARLERARVPWPLPLSSRGRFGRVEALQAPFTPFGRRYPPSASPWAFWRPYARRGGMVAAADVTAATSASRATSVSRRLPRIGGEICGLMSDKLALYKRAPLCYTHIVRHPSDILTHSP